MHFTHCPDEEGTEMTSGTYTVRIDNDFTHCPDEEGTEID